MFTSLHLMFETQYDELAIAVRLRDDRHRRHMIAERIRSLGAPAPGSYREFIRLSSIAEEDDCPDAVEMIRRLVAGQEAVARTARSHPGHRGPAVVFPIADGAHDEATADLLTQRLQVHEKTAWMLRSLLE